MRAGAAALSKDVDLVLVHDAARPFVDAGVIDRVVVAAREAGAAIAAVQVRDTVKRVAGDGITVAETLARDEIWLAQTPQGFRRDVLDRLVALGEQESEATDEAVLAERLGQPVRVVLGDARNVKITASIEKWRPTGHANPRVSIIARPSNSPTAPVARSPMGPDGMPP